MDTCFVTLQRIWQMVLVFVRIVRAVDAPLNQIKVRTKHEVTKKIGQARRRVRPTSVQRRQRDTFAGCSSVVGSWRLPIASCVQNFVRFRSGLMLFNPDSSQANEDTFLEVWGYFFFKKVCNTAHFLAQFAWKVPIFLHMWKNFCNFARFFGGTNSATTQSVRTRRTLTYKIMMQFASHHCGKGAHKWIKVCKRQTPCTSRCGLFVVPW